MPSTFWGLGIGTSGLYANQMGLNTTGHNISNAETDGYTRQTANQSAGIPISTRNTTGMAGTGVVITSVTQTRSAYFDSKFRENSAIAGEYNTKSDYMNEIQNYLNDLTGDGFTKTFDSFYETLHELQKNPSDKTYREQAIGFAKTFTEYFNGTAESLASAQKSLNFEVKNQVDRINTISQQIATLNQQINRVEINGQNANDIRDKRNQLIDELSEIANVTTFERKSEDGTGLSQFRVMIDGNLLVENGDYNSLKVEPRSSKDAINQNDAEGLYDVKWSTGADFNITSPSLTGTLKSLIDIRDGNNNENFKGNATAASAGDNKIVVTGTNINDVTKLNIPETNGKITIGSKEYTYDHFTITKNGDNYEYEFTLSGSTTLDANVAANTKVQIGESLEYKGIPYYMSRMNEFVRTYAQSFNEIHNDGVDLYGKKAGNFFTAENKTLTVDDTSTSTAMESTYYRLTAANFTISGDLKSDPMKMSTATDIVNGKENHDIVDKLIGLKLDKTMFKQGSPAEYLQTFVADIGIDTKIAENFAKSQTNILNSVKNQRLSVSGVDKDEETMKLLKYQQGYNLCAHVISVMNEVLDKLINGTGI